MNEKFFDLAKEKQDRMINGAVEVFAKNGYKHASTDDMVKAVGISKGLWFHYFGSKEGIYVFVYDYCVKYMLLELSTVVNEEEKDYFRLMKQIALVKTRIARNYPYLVVFLERAAQESWQGMTEKTAPSRQSYEERIETIFKAVQVGQVPDRAKGERIRTLLENTVDSIIREAAGTDRDSDAVYREIEAYIDLVKEMAAGLVGSLS